MSQRRVQLTAETHTWVDVPDCPPPVHEAGQIRNLLYHLAPFRATGCWRWSVQQLLRRLPLFNGRRIVAITKNGKGRETNGAKTDLATEDIDTVRRAFDGHDVEIIEFENDNDRREVVSFVALLEQVQTDDPRHVTLYAQSKAVTRHYHCASHLWASTIHELYLDYWPLTQRLLRERPVVGALKTVGRWHEFHHGWFFDGSWCWFRNKDHFAKDWRRIHERWDGAESYFSLHYPENHTGLIFYDQMDSHLTLYKWPTWTGKVLPALQRFRVEHAADFLDVVTTPPPLIDDRLANLVRESRMDAAACPFPEAEWQRFDGVYGLVNMLRSLPRLRSVCEVGSFRGVSTEVFLRFADRVQVVDVWQDADGLYSEMERRESEFRERTAAYPNLSVLKSMSPGAAATFTDGSFDLVYIDARHDYASVAADVCAWLPKVRKGGWIAGHDYTPLVENGDLCRAVRDTVGEPDAVFEDSSWLKRVP